MVLGFRFFIMTIGITLKFSFLDPFGEYEMADRYTYVPYIGLSYLIAKGIVNIYNQKNRYQNLLKAGVALLWYFYVL